MEKQTNSYAGGFQAQEKAAMTLAEESELLRQLDSDLVRQHLQSGNFRIVPFASGQMIHFEGEFCQKLEIILDGEVSIERIDPEGHLLTVARCSRDELLGGNLLFSANAYYPMTLSAVDDVLLLTIDKELLFQLLSSHPAFLRVFLAFISDHAALLGDKIRHYVQKSIRECLINFLRQEYQRQKTNPIRLNITKKHLADRIGVQRTSVSRELAKMRRDGLVEYDGDSIVIRDRTILEE